MILRDAIKLAERIRTDLAPYCDRIDIAGSIRRARPEVNDIDLVVLTRDRAGFEQRCLRTTTAVINGPQTMIVRLRTGFQLDIWFARPAEQDLLQPIPSNWGSLLLCRTGSREHNIWICKHALDIDLKWDPYRGVVDVTNKILASETEEEIYRFLGIDFIPPAFRETSFLHPQFGRTLSDKNPLQIEPPKCIPVDPHAAADGFIQLHAAIQSHPVNNEPRPN